jgi:Fe-S cluster assembly protein SufD
MSVSLAVLAEAVGGLPGPRSERWKYTSLRALSARNFSTSSDAVAVDAAILAAIPEPRIVFVNGRFDAGLSRLDALATGLSVQALSQAPVGMPDGRFDDADETFARLNAALAEDGAVIRVAADTQVAVPMHLVFVGAASETDLAIHARHLVELREDATLIVIEHHLAAGAHRHLANHLVHIHLKPGSRLVHARVQDEDPGAALIARTDAVLASRSEYRRLDLELGAGLSRHELNVLLQGEQARVIAGGALLAIGRQHVDTRLGVEHIARDTSCDLHWRGLASGRGRVAFHGGIVIRAGADGSDAALSSRNLLLSDGAEIDTQPVLEIHADEVKAAHGATVGRLNDTALFYLRSRGIPEAQARALLTLAFCREVLSVLDDPSLAESLSGTLEARLSELELAP